MDLDKIFMHKEFLQKSLTFEEISKLYREVLYDKYKNTEDPDIIHAYQLLRSMIDIFTQMTDGRKFDKKYLEATIKW